MKGWGRRFKKMRNDNNITCNFKPKVLFVTSIMPIPIDAGNKQRTDQSIKALLMAGAEVTVLVIAKAHKERTVRALEAAYPGAEIAFVGRSVSIAERIKNRQYLRAAVTALAKAFERVISPRWLISNRRTCPPELLREIRRQAKSHNVYFSNYAKVTPILNFSFTGVSICDTHDLQSRRLDIFLRERNANWMKRMPRLALFRLSEKLALMKFDHVLSISDVELPEMKRLVGTAPQFHYAPATFEMTGAPGEPGAPSFDIGFIGTSSKPNIDGLVWFLREIYPDLLRRRPDLSMWIVGKVTLSQSVKDAARPYNIKLTEFVEDVAPAYSCARVWLCPIRFGTGMKIKAVEGLAMSAAMVGTSTAFESIAVRDGIDAMIADDARVFADKVERLLGDEELALELRKNARLLFQRDHSLAAYSALLRKLISSGPLADRN